MSKLVIFSEQKSFIKKPASSDCIIAQERSFYDRGNGNVQILYKSKFLKNLSRITKKMGLGPIADGFTKKKYDDSVVFYIAMHLDYLKSNRYLLKNFKNAGNKLALYVYDCWEPEFDAWQKEFEKIEPDYIFFGFKQTWEHFKDILKCEWVPQSADLYNFKALDIPKTRLFIQMGRVNPQMHEAIESYLTKNEIPDIDDNYVYRKQKKTNLYPELSKLVEEINRTKYIVSIPKCYENFKRTGNISAMTGRYYESIVCKTLMIGKKPYIFDELFPSDGMIEFKDDLSDFDEKINELENNPEKYYEIVNKNYDCFMKNHTWAHRYDRIMDIIDQDKEH